MSSLYLTAVGKVIVTEMWNTDSYAKILITGIGLPQRLALFKQFEVLSGRFVGGVFDPQDEGRRDLMLQVLGELCPVGEGCEICFYGNGTVVVSINTVPVLKIDSGSEDKAWKFFHSESLVADPEFAEELADSTPVVYVVREPESELAILDLVPSGNLLSADLREYDFAIRISGDRRQRMFTVSSPMEVLSGEFVGSFFDPESYESLERRELMRRVFSDLFPVGAFCEIRLYGDDTAVVTVNSVPVFKVVADPNYEAWTFCTAGGLTTFASPADQL